MEDLNAAAHAYETTVLQPLLNQVQGYGRYSEEGQRPGEFAVGVHVYCARRQWMGPIEWIEGVNVKVRDRWEWDNKKHVWAHRRMNRIKPVNMKTEDVVVAAAKYERLEELRKAALILCLHYAHTLLIQ
jgi:hypothetical protein